MSAATVARSETAQDEPMDQAPAKASTSNAATKNRKKAAAVPVAKPRQAKGVEKKPANHPKYSDMIRQAVAALHDRGGSSRQALLKYIMANFDVGSDTKTINNHLKMALRAGVKNGTLQQAKGTGASGSFKVGVKVKARSTDGRVKKPKAIKTAKSPAKAKPKTQKASAKKTKAPQTSGGPVAKKAKTEKPSPATAAKKGKTAAKTAKASSQAPESKAPKSQKVTPVQPSEAAKSAKPALTKPAPKPKTQKATAKRPAAKGRKPAASAEDQPATSLLEADTVVAAENTAGDASSTAKEAAPSNEAGPVAATSTNDNNNAAPTAEAADAAMDSQSSVLSGQEPASDAVAEKGASKPKQTAGRGRKGGAKSAAQR